MCVTLLACLFRRGTHVVPLFFPYGFRVRVEMTLTNTHDTVSYARVLWTPPCLPLVSSLILMDPAHRSLPPHLHTSRARSKLDILTTYMSPTSTT